jgi:hypothetical protein
MAPENQDQMHAIVEQFKRGANRYHEGREDEDIQVQGEGKKDVFSALRALDALGPHGRDALIPLLDDPNPGIRVYAAGSLVKRMPELALPVLEDIKDYCITLAHRSASDMLWKYGKGILGL